MAHKKMAGRKGGNATKKVAMAKKKSLAKKPMKARPARRGY